MVLGSGPIRIGQGIEFDYSSVHCVWTLKELGYEVIHESKALYQVVISDPSTKSGTRKTSYFGFSQVRPIEA